MPACVSAEPIASRGGRTRRLLLVSVLALGATAGAAAAFRVNAVQPRIAGQALLLDGNLELGLTGKVEEALSNGIPIEIVVDVRLQRRRSLLWDETIDDWGLRRHLRYHALSGQYLVHGEPTLHGRESFDSLSEALAHIGSLEEVSLPIEASLAPDAEYRVNVRVALDVEALPPLLRPVAYTSRAWDLNSGWTSWTVQR